MQETEDKVKQIQSKISELTSQQETLRRDLQVMSTTLQRAEVCMLANLWPVVYSPIKFGRQLS